MTGIGKMPHSSVMQCFRRLPGLRYDIQVFQLLPLYVRVETLRGIPVFVRNERLLYETATRTIREFEDFKHRLHDYTGKAPIA